ncbi:MAG: thioredoxin-disulfide reductase [Patescibacteria group bacterium]
MVSEVVILGSGPAGLTAAIYAARAGLSPIVVSGPQPGGQLTMTTEVENFPGFEGGVQGPELMEVMKRQAARFGTIYKDGWVNKVDLASNPKKIFLEGGETLDAKAVIIATGASAIWLGAPGEKELQGRGVSACATCDGFFFRGKKVVVVGGGDSAMEEATFLTKFVSEVVVIHRREELRASKAMQERAKANAKITFLLNKEVKEVLGVDNGRVSGVRIVDNVTGEETTVECDGYFAAIGHKPNTDMFQGKLDLDIKGYIILKNPPSSKTSVEGVFAAGDVADHTYRQAITAAGTGCVAALDAERWFGH